MICICSGMVLCGVMYCLCDVVKGTVYCGEVL